MGRFENFDGDNRSQTRALAEQIRMGPTAVTLFAVGLLLLAPAGVLTAVATAGAGLGRAVGVAFAAGMVLFLPQFSATAPLRIGHGVLLGLGCVVLALAGRATRTEEDPRPERELVSPGA